MKKPKVLGIGVATMDIYVKQKCMYPGGNEFNVVCNAKFMGAEAGFLGVFGNDKYGVILENTLRDVGVCLDLCRHEEGTSGYSLVELTDDGDRIFLDWNRTGVADLYPIQFTEEEIAYIQRYDVVSIGKCSNVTIEQIQKMKHSGIDVCYDFFASFDEEEIEEKCPFLSYAFFSCSHLSVEEIKEVLSLAVEKGCKVAVGTRGADPVLAYDGTDFFEQKTREVEHVLDALGAGDSYIGAFLTTYLQNDDVPEKERIAKALDMAAGHAAEVIQRRGSIGIGFDVESD